jgi:predicted RNA-binding Zn ribbon-like protein
MTPITEPLAVAFANTRSSTRSDRIATLEQVRQWAAPWAVLGRFLSSLDATALEEIQAVRDSTQTVLRHLAEGSPPPGISLRRATLPGLAAAPFQLLAPKENVLITPGEGDAMASVVHLLSRGVVDLILSPDATRLRTCQGAGCLKIFIGQRADRRWCDSKVCGNRARVAAHTRRT